jgi:hypothetical protein
MVEKDSAVSGQIPSSSIPSIFWAIANGAAKLPGFWKKVKEIDPGLEEHFKTNQDQIPNLEGAGDGLLVISWDHKCIESFQSYTPARHAGNVIPHDGEQRVAQKEPLDYQIEDSWSIIDHHFEESRH